MSHTDNDLAEKGFSHVLSRPRSRRLLTICEITLLTIALLIPACGGFYRYNYYSHFQQGYSLEHAWSTFWLALIVMGLLQSLSLAAWYNRVRLILALRERGQLTKGVVSSHEQYRTKYGTRTIAIISYKAIDSDGGQVKCTMQGPESLPKKGRVSVCYDPYQPQRALLGGFPTQASLTSWIILALVLLTAISVGASLITFMIG